MSLAHYESACLKATGLGLCIKLKQAGCEPILQMTGRDRNRMALMGDALAAAAFGIDSMLALTGDHPVCAGGDCKDAKPVYDLDSVGILRMLTEMEETGRDCGGNPLSGNKVDKETGEIVDKSATPKIYKGASVTPLYDPISCRSISCVRRMSPALSTFRLRVSSIWIPSSASWTRSIRLASRPTSWQVSFL